MKYREKWWINFKKYLIKNNSKKIQKMLKNAKYRDSCKPEKIPEFARIRPNSREFVRIR